MKYNTTIVLAYFTEMGIPEPQVEHQFALDIDRKWAWDFSWEMIYRNPHLESADVPSFPMLALEVDGGLFLKGAHNQGARMLKTWERDNEAACRGWRIIRCQPKELCTLDTVNLIKRALNI